MKHRKDYHPIKKWLDAPGFVIVIPQPELLPRLRKKKLTPSANQLVQEKLCSII